MAFTEAQLRVLDNLHVIYDGWLQANRTLYRLGPGLT
jgi:hypothetical protein